jgi:hypothetical protein
VVTDREEFVTAEFWETRREGKSAITSPAMVAGVACTRAELRVEKVMVPSARSRTGSRVVLWQNIASEETTGTKA